MQARPLTNTTEQWPVSKHGSKITASLRHNQCHACDREHTFQHACRSASNGCNGCIELGSGGGGGPREGGLGDARELAQQPGGDLPVDPWARKSGHFSRFSIRRHSAESSRMHRLHKTFPRWSSDWELGWHGSSFYGLSSALALGEVLASESDKSDSKGLRDAVETPSR